MIGRWHNITEGGSRNMC